MDVRDFAASLVLGGSLIASSACADDVPGAELGGGEGTSTEAGDEVGESGEGESESGESEGGEGESGETGVAGCSELPGPWDAGYAIPKQPSPPGDPELGRQVLFEEDYVSCGVPWSLWGLMQPFLGTLGAGESLAWRPGKNAEVPYSWTVVELSDGSEMVVPNCLQCHGGSFDGELILGLGGHHLDFTTDMGTLLGAAPPILEITEADEQFNKFIDRFSVMGPPSTMRTVGTNPAIMYAVVLVTHRNPFTLAWLDEALFELPANVMVPADPPPWWRLNKKAAHFANGMSRGDHRGTMILASSLCTDDAATAASIVDDFAHLNAYLESLEPPAYSGPPVDEALAAEGEALFECNCAGCHGTYAEDPADESYPNLLLPLELVGTDPVMASYAANQLNYLEQWFQDSYYGTVTDLETADPFVGYVAPPLDAIWATAPYFHNGSVPSLELVLNSSARPTYWKRVDYESTNYDWAALGWPWTPVDYGQNQAPVSERKYIYDTTQVGHSNAGHVFGDHFTAAERAAVLEYLKTI